MDERSIIRLNKIRTKTAPELSDEEIGFLKARGSYLSLDDKDRFKSVLIEKKELKKKK